MAGKDALARVAGSGQSPVSVSMMKVDSVRTDGTVNLRDGATLHPAIPCHNGYLDRAAGDRVVVMRWAAGWFVLGKAGPETAHAAGVELSWGDAAPAGTGWVTGSVWVREGELYVQTASPPPASTTPVTLSPTSQGAWRDGGRDSDQAPTQGAWPTYPHAYTGAWFYGSSIVTACAGKTVASMKVRIERSGSTHGSFGGVRPLLYLALGSSATSSPPSLTSGPQSGPSLALGSDGYFTLPSSWADALAAGSAHGLGIKAGVGDSYLICTSSCGQITITFD